MSVNFEQASQVAAAGSVAKLKTISIGRIPFQRFLRELFHHKKSTRKVSLELRIPCNIVNSYEKRLKMLPYKHTCSFCIFNLMATKLSVLICVVVYWICRK